MSSNHARRWEVPSEYGFQWHRPLSRVWCAVVLYSVASLFIGDNREGCATRHFSQVRERQTRNHRAPISGHRKLRSPSHPDNCTVTLISVDQIVEDGRTVSFSKITMVVCVGHLVDCALCHGFDLCSGVHNCAYVPVVLRVFVLPFEHGRFEPHGYSISSPLEISAVLLTARRRRLPVRLS